MEDSTTYGDPDNHTSLRGRDVQHEVVDLKTSERVHGEITAISDQSDDIWSNPTV
jgi:hypothetical protein